MDFGIARAVADAASTMTADRGGHRARRSTCRRSRPAASTSTPAATSTRPACMLYELLTGRPPFTRRLARSPSPTSTSARTRCRRRRSSRTCRRRSTPIVLQGARQERRTTATRPPARCATTSSARSAGRPVAGHPGAPDETRCDHHRGTADVSPATASGRGAVAFALLALAALGRDRRARRARDLIARGRWPAARSTVPNLVGRRSGRGGQLLAGTRARARDGHRAGERRRTEGQVIEQNPAAGVRASTRARRSTSSSPGSGTPPGADQSPGCPRTRRSGQLQRAPSCRSPTESAATSSRPAAEGTVLEIDPAAGTAGPRGQRRSRSWSPTARSRCPNVVGQDGDGAAARSSTPASGPRRRPGHVDERPGRHGPRQSPSAGRPGPDRQS